MTSLTAKRSSILLRTLILFMLIALLNGIAMAEEKNPKNEGFRLLIFSTQSDELIEQFYDLIDQYDTNNVVDTKYRPTGVESADAIMFLLVQWDDIAQLTFLDKSSDLVKGIMGNGKDVVAQVYSTRLASHPIKVIAYALQNAESQYAECYAKHLLKHLDNSLPYEPTLKFCK